MSLMDSPIPLSELESVLAWVDTFKLSRPNRKINRDFSDAVLLAEILGVHYPKLVEMHNYPPRNSHALKLNNWMTLNRKVLKKLKLNLCVNTMEQLANCAPGIIERVLVAVRDKIQRDEELNKSTRDAEQNVSSGGSYYEALGDDEQIIVIPVKTRVNGVLETVQQKVISYDIHFAMKEEFKDAKETADVLKLKVEHLTNLLTLKEERIDELQNQLERKQSRRKEAENLQNSLSVPFEPLSPVTKVETKINQDTSTILNKVNPEFTQVSSHLMSNAANDLTSTETISDYISLNVSDNINQTISSVSKISPERSLENKAKLEESKIPIKVSSRHSIHELVRNQGILPAVSSKVSERTARTVDSKTSISEARSDLRSEGRSEDTTIDPAIEVDRVKSDVFKEAEAIEIINVSKSFAENKDNKDSTSNPENTTTIEETVTKEINEILQPNLFAKDYTYFN